MALCRYLFVVLFLISPAASAATLGDLVRASGLPRYQVEIIGQIPHDTTSFTQGLCYESGVLFESTGLYGHASVRKINPRTGGVLQSVALDSVLFGEGLTLYEDKTIVLTWREQTALLERRGAGGVSGSGAGGA